MPWLLYPFLRVLRTRSLKPKKPPAVLRGNGSPAPQGYPWPAGVTIAAPLIVPACLSPASAWTPSIKLLPANWPRSLQGAAMNSKTQAAVTDLSAAVHAALGSYPEDIMEQMRRASDTMAWMSDIFRTIKHGDAS
jgi:hypothetical protein